MSGLFDKPNWTPDVPDVGAMLAVTELILSELMGEPIFTPVDKSPVHVSSVPLTTQAENAGLEKITTNSKIVQKRSCFMVNHLDYSLLCREGIQAQPSAEGNRKRAKRKKFSREFKIEAIYQGARVSVAQAAQGLTFRQKEDTSKHPFTPECGKLD
jgi:hypothetical protein